MRMIVFITAAVFFLCSFSFSQCLDKDEINRLKYVFKTGMPKNKALKLAEEHGWVRWNNCWNNRCSFRTANPKDYKNRYVLEVHNDTLANFYHTIMKALSFDDYVRQFGKTPPGHDSIVLAIKNGYNERMRKKNVSAPCEEKTKSKYSDTAKTLPIDATLSKLQLGVTRNEMFCVLNENGWRWNNWRKYGQTERKVIDECGDTIGIIQPIGYYIFKPKTEINENTLCLAISVIYEGGDINGEYNWVDEIKVMTSKEIQKKYYYREYLNEERKKKNQKGFWEPRRAPPRRPTEN